eukprot:scaffold423_cov69-Phaeocystis_antarctica.AAC.2
MQGGTCPIASKNSLAIPRLDVYSSLKPDLLARLERKRLVLAKQLHQTALELAAARKGGDPDRPLADSAELSQVELDVTVPLLIADRSAGDVEVVAVGRAAIDAAEAEDRLHRTRAVHNLPVMHRVPRGQARHPARRGDQLGAHEAAGDVLVAQARKVGQHDRRARVPLRSALLAKRAPDAVAKGEALEDYGIRQPPRLVHVHEQQPHALAITHPAVSVHRCTHSRTKVGKLARQKST